MGEAKTTYKIAIFYERIVRKVAKNNKIKILKARFTRILQEILRVNKVKN